MEFQLWNNRLQIGCSDTANYGCLGLLNTGYLKKKQLEVVLTDQKMKFLTVPKVGTV